MTGGYTCVASCSYYQGLTVLLLNLCLDELAVQTGNIAD